METTISHPEITSHRGLTAEERAQLGVGPGTVRVSVGIEAADDIVADFAHALVAADDSVDVIAHAPECLDGIHRNIHYLNVRTFTQHAC